MTSTIKYEEIRKGDTIKVTETYPSGFQNIQVGVAIERLNEGYDTDRWLTSIEPVGTNSVVLASKTNAASLANQEIELVKRPRIAPPKTHGTIIRITETKNYSGTPDTTHRLAILDTDGEWCAFAYPSDVGSEYYQADHIMSWNPVSITDLPHSNN